LDQTRRESIALGVLELMIEKWLDQLQHIAKWKNGRINNSSYQFQPIKKRADKLQPVVLGVSIPIPSQNIPAQNEKWANRRELLTMSAM
jgi:hypothetical protein